MNFSYKRPRIEDEDTTDREEGEEEEEEDVGEEEEEEEEEEKEKRKRQRENKTMKLKYHSCIAKQEHDGQYKLQEHQKKVCNYMQSHDRLLAYHGTGTGKTLTGIAVAKCFLQVDNRKVIIISPLSVIQQWRAELLKSKVSDSDITIFGGKSGTLNAPYILMTHNHLRLYMMTIKSGKAPTLFDNNLIIFDEIHNFRTDIKEKRFSIADYAFQASDRALKVLGLTATPIVNSINDFLNIMAIITGEKIPKYNPKGGGFQTIFRLLSRFRANISMHKIVDVDEDNFPTYQVINKNITMTPEAEIGYKSMIKDNENFVANFYRDFRHGDVVSTNEMDVDTKSGFIIEKLKKQMRTTGKIKKTVIYSNFIARGIASLQRHTDDVEAVDLDSFTIDGSTTDTERRETVERFNNPNEKIKILFISKAGSEGLDLKGVRNIFIMEPNWNPALDLQIIGRGVRHKSHRDLPQDERNVTIYRLFLQTSDGKPTFDHIMDKYYYADKKVLIDRVDNIVRNYICIESGQPPYSNKSLTESAYIPPPIPLQTIKREIYKVFPQYLSHDLQKKRIAAMKATKRRKYHAVNKSTMKARGLS